MAHLTYTGFRSRSQRGCKIPVVHVSGHPLIHHKKHSPDGFEWGYCGSGPAELARCILIDYILRKAGGKTEPPLSNLHTAIAEMYVAQFYREFMSEIVAGLPREGWVITGNEIGAWLMAKKLEKGFR